MEQRENRGKRKNVNNCRTSAEAVARREAAKLKRPADGYTRDLPAVAAAGARAKKRGGGVEISGS